MEKLQLQQLSKQLPALLAHPSVNLADNFDSLIILKNNLKKRKERFKTRLKEKEIVIQKQLGVVKKVKKSKHLNCVNSNAVIFPKLISRFIKRAATEKGVIGENLYKKEKKTNYQNFSKKKIVLFSSSKFKEKEKKKKISFHSRKNAAIIHVLGTYNNTLYTLSSTKGKTSFCISTGMCGFRNSRKSTSYASQKAAEKLLPLAKKYANIHIKMQGLGPGKVGGVRTLYKSGLKIKNIQECTALPHNGCRPAKQRRL